MLAALTANPLVTRLAGRHRWPSLQACLWLAFGLGLAGAAVGAARAWNVVGGGELLQLMLPLLMLFTFVSPMGVLFLASALTVREVDRQAYQLLVVTTLSDAHIVRGYVVAALQRVRLPLALIGGMIPWSLTGLLEAHAWYARLTCGPYAHTLISNLTCFMPGIQSTLVWLPILVGAWGLNWLGAAFGVALGLWWRNTLPATLVTPLAIAAMTLSAFSLMLVPQDLSGLIWASAVLWMLAPFVLAPLVMRLAERWVRSTR